MGLPVLPSVAAEAIINVVLQGKAVMAAAANGNENSAGPVDLECWFNAAGLILVSLPESYWLSLHDRLVTTIESLATWKHKHSPLTLFNFKAVNSNGLYSEYANLLGICHAVWHHLGTGHIHHILT